MDSRHGLCSFEPGPGGQGERGHCVRFGGGKRGGVFLRNYYTKKQIWWRKEFLGGKGNGGMADSVGGFQ